jgi:hypothetical protein
VYLYEPLHRGTVKLGHPLGEHLLVHHLRRDGHVPQPAGDVRELQVDELHLLPRHHVEDLVCGEGPLHEAAVFSDLESQLQRHLSERI